MIVAGIVANISLSDLAEVKALYDAAVSAVAMLERYEQCAPEIEEARRVLVDALINFMEKSV